eukprot:scaffold436654_cov47-Prasinocladus_malaysianus.AAC.1
MGESNAQAARVTGLKARPGGSSSRAAHQRKVEAAKARREAESGSGNNIPAPTKGTSNGAPYDYKSLGSSIYIADKKHLPVNIRKAMMVRDDF